MSAPSPGPLPTRRLKLAEALDWEGQTWLLTVGFAVDGAAREIFLNPAKTNRSLDALAQDSCILASHLLQAGMSVADLRARLRPVVADAAGALAPDVEAPSLLGMALMLAARLEAQSRQAIAEAYAAAQAGDSRVVRQALAPESGS